MENQNPPQQTTAPQPLPPLTPKNHTVPLVIGAFFLVAVAFGTGYIVRGITTPLPMKPSGDTNPPLTSMPSLNPTIATSLLTPSITPDPTYPPLATPTKDPRSVEEKRITGDGKYTFQIMQNAAGEDIRIMRIDGDNFADGRNYFLVSELTDEPISLQKGSEPYWQSNTELVIIPKQDLVRVVHIVNAEKKTIKEVPAGS